MRLRDVPGLTHVLLQVEEFPALSKKLPLARWNDFQIIPTVVPRGDYKGCSSSTIPHRRHSIGNSWVGVAEFDDSMGVTLTGTLQFALSPAKLFESPDSAGRPNLLSTWHVDEWALGTLKTVEGLPGPEIEDRGGCVTIPFRLAPRR